MAVSLPDDRILPRELAVLAEPTPIAPESVTRIAPRPPVVLGGPDLTSL
jgi:hypothetical protein